MFYNFMVMLVIAMLIAINCVTIVIIISNSTAAVDIY